MQRTVIKLATMVAVLQHVVLGWRIVLRHVMRIASYPAMLRTVIRFAIKVVVHSNVVLEFISALRRASKDNVQPVIQHGAWIKDMESY
jgi:uncharacterized transporter YbjL